MAYKSRIAGITVQIGGDTTKLESALKGLDKTISSTKSSLNDVNRLLKLDPGNTELLTQKQTALKSAISETKDRLATLQEAAKSNDLGAAEHDAIQREIIDTEQKLKNLEKQYKSFGSVAAQQIKVVGDKMQEVGGKVSAVGQQISGFGNTLTLGLTVPIVAFGTKAASSFAEVDKTMSLTNQTMGNTVEQAELLNNAMKEAAANSTFGMSDAANALLNFARAGLSAEQAAAALAPAMNLAAGEGGNLDTVSAGLVATINGFHGSFDQAGTYADTFAAACNNSALDVDSLSNAMSVAAPIFASAGYQVNDAALYMGIMANNGIDADKAANSLKTGIARLVKPAKEGADMMKKLGISIVDSNGNMKTSVQVQAELHDAFGRLTEAQQIAAASAIFGKNQMAPWLALINTAPADVDALNSSIQNCAGTTDQMAQAMMGGFGGSIEKLKSSIDVLVTSLGQALAPTLQKVIDWIQGLVDKFNALSPAQQDMIVKIGLAVAAFGPLVSILGKVVSGVGGVITIAGKLTSGFGSIVGVVSRVASGFGSLGSAGSVLGTVIGGLTSPIGATIAILGVLATAGVAVWKNWDSIKAWATKTWSAIKDTVSKAAEGVKNAVTTAWDAVKTKTTELWDNVKSGVTTAWNNIKSAVTTGATNVKSAVTSAWDNVKTATTNAWNNVKTGISNAWNNIKSAVSSAADNVKSKVSTAWDSIKTKTSTAWDNIKSKTASIWDNVKSKVSGVMSTLQKDIADGMSSSNSKVEGVLKSISNVFNSTFNGIKNFVSEKVSWLKKIFDFKWELPKIKLPHFKIEGNFSLNPPSIPHFSIDWYKKAMDGAMVLNSPTIFGAQGGRLLGGGEAGREVVSGEDHLINMINSTVDSALGSRMDSITALLERYLPGCADTKVMPVSSMDSALARNQVRRAGAW